VLTFGPFLVQNWPKFGRKIVRPLHFLTFYSALILTYASEQSAGWQHLSNDKDVDIFRYLTTLQLVQFVTFFLHACFPLFIDCNFPVVFREIATIMIIITDLKCFISFRKE
jgi:hypothetical protein